MIKHYQSIACKLFIEVEDPKWGDTDDNVKLLGESVKNWVTVYAISAVSSYPVPYIFTG